jgi:hypothetical protein
MDGGQWISSTQAVRIDPRVSLKIIPGNVTLV